jgi:uncharacterized iron-regulated membrane protein
MRPNKLRRSLNRWSRNVHRWGSIAIFLPLLIVIVSGILLLLKKQIGWIQPPTADGPLGPPTVAFEHILGAVASIPEAAVSDWADIDRLDIRPDEGLAKVQCDSGYEVQVSTVTGEVLQTAYRRSDLIESIHDGSFFHKHAKLWVFLPNAIIVGLLWLTGLWLWLVPHLRSKKRPTPAN